MVSKEIIVKPNSEHMTGVLNTNRDTSEGYIRIKKSVYVDKDWWEKRWDNIYWK